MHDDNNTSLDLSVIVPAYNTETFIEHCLVSLCEQDYDPSRFEVIVVDDASPDGLASVVRRLQKKYVNLRYLRQLHGRQGKAKNYGLREAKGKYIAFMDSDDCWRYANTISILVDILRKNHLDLLQSDVALNVWHGELPQLDREKDIPPVSVYDRNTYLQRREFLFSNCFSLYRRELLQSIPPFRENTAFEDSDWSHAAVWAVGEKGRIGSIQWRYYAYRLHPDSTVRKPNLQVFYDNISGVRAIVDFLNQCHEMNEITRTACMERVKDSILSWIRISRDYALSDSLRVFAYAEELGLLKSSQGSSPRESLTISILRTPLSSLNDKRHTHVDAH